MDGVLQDASRCNAYPDLHPKKIRFLERFVFACRRPSPTVTKKGQKSPKNWEVTVGDTHMYTLRTREKK